MKVKIKRNDNTQFTLDDVLKIFSCGNDELHIHFYNEDGELQKVKYIFPVEIKGFMSYGK